MNGSTSSDEQSNKQQRAACFDQGADQKEELRHKYNTAAIDASDEEDQDQQNPENPNEEPKE